MSARRAVLSLLLAAAVAAPVAAPGCTSTTQSKTVTKPRSVRVGSSGRPTPGASASGGTQRARSDAVDTNACARQLHAIAGAVLLHYAIHKRLPDDLEGLRGMADIDQELSFTCPVSGERYTYNPTGLEYQGREERLIIYDASASHRGARWGIKAVAPHGTHPAATYVVQLPEGVFRLYQPVQVAPPVPEPEREPAPEAEAEAEPEAKPQRTPPPRGRTAPAEER